MKNFDLFALAQIGNLGGMRIRNLLTAFGTAENVLKASLTEISKVEQIGPHSVKAFKKDRDKCYSAAEKQLKQAKEMGFKTVTFLDEEYPEVLKKITVSPPYLFIRGEIKDEDFYSISVVGTRELTHYGKKSTEEIVRGLVEEDYTIISGLALGIDSAAHRVALGCGGRTIAVVGAGLDIKYPSRNIKLAERIAENGAVISEFPLGTQPRPSNFPKRNVTIAALSQGTLVVEAGKKSGALITALLALDLNKQVFAVPGSIFSPKSFGTNTLVKRGAVLVRNTRDILNELVWQEKTRKNYDLLLKSNEKIVNLPPAQKRLYDSLSCEPQHIDDIAEELNRSVTNVLIDLFSLEMEGIVKQLPGKLFVKI